MNYKAQVKFWGNVTEHRAHMNDSGNKTEIDPTPTMDAIWLTFQVIHVSRRNS